MSDSLSALFLQNPELAIALRRREEGNALQRMAGKQQIRNPWDGLNSAAQALMGAWDTKKADEEFKAAADASSAEVSDYARLLQGLPGMGGQSAQPQAPAAPLPPAQTEGGAPAPVSGDPRDLAIRTILAEAGGDGGAGMSAVAHVINNRVKSGKWGDNAGSVVMAPLQFSPWNQGSTNDPRRFNPNSPEYQNAAKIYDAVASGQIPDPTGGALNFANPKASTASWVGQAMAGDPANRTQIGNHVFFRGLDVGAPPQGGVPRETAAAPAQAAPDMQAQPRQSAMMDIYLRGIQSNNPRVRAIAQGLAPFIKQNDEAKVLAPGAMLMDRQGRILAQNPNDPTMNRINLNNDMRGPTTFEQKRGEALAERVGEWDASWENSQKTLGNITAFRRAMQDVQTGIGSGAQITLGQVGQRLGVPEQALSAIGLDPKKIADIETLRSMSSKFLLDQLGKGGFPAQNFSNADREMLERSLPGLANTPQGNEMIMAIMEAGARRQSEIGKAWREFAGANGEDINAARRFQREVLPKLVERDIIAPIFNDMKNAQPSPGAAPPAAAPRIRTWNPATGRLE